MSLAYATGLRSSEVVSLQLTDIDSNRMVIRVEQGKGKKDRYVVLSPNLLQRLREWWRVARKKGWMSAGYRAKADSRYKLMTLDADEFIRRFLIHVLPEGFPHPSL